MAEGKRKQPKQEDQPWWKLLTAREICDSADRLAAASGISEDEAIILVARTL